MGHDRGGICQPWLRNQEQQDPLHGVGASRAGQRGDLVGQVLAHLFVAHRVAELRLDDEPWTALRVNALQVELPVGDGPFSFERRDRGQVDARGLADDVEERGPCRPVIQQQAERFGDDVLVEPARRQTPQQGLMLGHTSKATDEATAVRVLFALMP